MVETDCKFVSSHGIMKSCSLKILRTDEPNIIYNLGSLKERDTLYVNSNCFLDFYKIFWKYIRVPIILVTGNSDVNFPEIFDVYPNTLDSILKEVNLIHWFSQNMSIQHPKCTPIPIGLDYHTLYSHLGMRHPWGNGCLPVQQEQMLEELRNENIPYYDRVPMAFCNWHFFADRGDRREALEKIDTSALYITPSYQDRNLTWKMQKRFAFVTSPRGGGLDCHRTWESLCLGNVAIVKTSGADVLYDGLPVWIVNDWSEVTKEAVERKKIEFAQKQDLFNSPKLLLSYWMDKIRSAK